jgi:glycosyltransferase involved in cell wall biosynthesis
MNEKRILVLYADLMGYTVSVLNVLDKLGYQIYVVHWGGKFENINKHSLASNITLFRRSDLSTRDLVALTLKISPCLIVASGWMDLSYLFICNKFKKYNIPTVCAMDTRWNGSFKQRFLCLLSRIFLKKYLFSKVWVPGIYQYEYARQLGFITEDIIFDLYTADTEVFTSDSFHIKRKNQLIYAGRISKEKNIGLLVEAWAELSRIYNDWTLIIVGGHHGDVFSEDFESNNIQHILSLPPAQLSELFCESKGFILPSLYEPWGLVVHEASYCSLPILASKNVGSASMFLINGFNGYTFDPLDKFELKQCIVKIIQSSDAELDLMGSRSKILAERISPLTSAANLISVLQ